MWFLLLDEKNIIILTGDNTVFFGDCQLYEKDCLFWQGEDENAG